MSAAPIEAIARAIRRERERTGLSLTELARRARIAKSTLSQLEAGTGNPSIETLWALGVALDVPFSRLVDTRSTPTVVIRAGEGPALRAAEANYTGLLLSACPPGARRDLYLITCEPGSPRIAEAHLPGSVEHVVLAAGRLRVGPDEEPVDLEPGDYARFPGDLPHRYEALVPGTMVVLMMEHV